MVIFLAHKLFPPPGVLQKAPKKDAEEIPEEIDRMVHAGKWPKKPTEVAVRKVFPTAAQVILPKEGQPCAGEVFVIFASAEAAKKAAEKWTTVGGKALKLTWAGVCGSPKPRPGIFPPKFKI